MIDRDHRGRAYFSYWSRNNTLWVLGSLRSIDIAWPVGRPRCLGFEVFNLGLSGMIRVHRWQFCWGFAQSWNRYCYLADRKLERIRWLFGGSR